MKTFGGFILVLILIFGFTSCSENGSYFYVTGRVVDIGDQSIKIEVEHISVDDADWFYIGGTNRIHDNCDCHGMWKSRKTYGTVFGTNGEVIGLEGLSLGDTVDIQGKIRADSEGKSYRDRPVFDNATVIDEE